MGDSGGGYLILELLVEEVSGKSFAEFMEHALLQPPSMTRSGYQQRGDADNSAKSYDAEGRPTTTFRYASKAATGFNKSAADMTKFVLAQLPMVQEKRSLRPPLKRYESLALRRRASISGASSSCLTRRWRVGTSRLVTTA